MTTQVPAVEGWFTMGEEPALLASRGVDTGSYFFPKNLAFSRNPAAPTEELAEVELSRRGRVWSWTTNHYQPPEPYVPVSDPYEPFAIAAVELAEEQIVVLGQCVDGVTVDDLSVGMEMELVLGTLYTEGDTEYVVWKWQPIGWKAAAASDQGGAS